MFLNYTIYYRHNEMLLITFVGNVALCSLVARDHEGTRVSQWRSHRFPYRPVLRVRSSFGAVPCTIQLELQ